MSEKKLYYIYIDTKIVGAIEQLVGYFRAQVFNKNDCINVICKYYKEVENNFRSIFKNNDIPYKFIKRQSDLSLEKGKTVFYLFNAQSNCRIVANRELIHIFVTHGESHKLASIKPIIRIYDYVVTSGKIGIERYLKSGIFTHHDVNIGKLITLGNTFLGNNNFIHDKKSDAIVYAPTWEGGVPEENYCSISLDSTAQIINFCKENEIRSLYIRPHPNTGHRDAVYKQILMSSIEKFRDSGLKVIINKDLVVKKWHSFFKKSNAPFTENNQISVRFSITDISAMEMQFINKKIPCIVLINNTYTSKLSIPKRLTEYYSVVFVSHGEKIKINLDSEKIRDSLIDYFITYPNDDIKNKNFRDRISWLCSYTRRHHSESREKLINLY